VVAHKVGSTEHSGRFFVGAPTHRDPNGTSSSANFLDSSFQRKLESSDFKRLSKSEALDASFRWHDDATSTIAP